MTESQKQNKKNFEKEIENLASEYFFGDKSYTIIFDLISKLQRYIPLQYPRIENKEIIKEVGEDSIYNAIKGFKPTEKSKGKFLHYFNVILKNDMNAERKKHNRIKEQNTVSDITNKENSIFDSYFDSRYNNQENDPVRKNIIENILKEINNVFKADTSRDNSNVEWKKAVYTHKLYDLLLALNLSVKKLQKNFSFVSSEILEKIEEKKYARTGRKKFSQKDVADVFGFDKSAYNSAIKIFKNKCRKNDKLKEFVKDL